LPVVRAPPKPHDRCGARRHGRAALAGPRFIVVASRAGHQGLLHEVVLARLRPVQSPPVTRLPQPDKNFKIHGASFRFYLGDCLDVLARLPEGSIDAIVTSPPYNLGVRYRSYDDTMPRARYLAWTGDWIGAAARVLSPSGS